MLAPGMQLLIKPFTTENLNRRISEVIKDVRRMPTTVSSGGITINRAAG